MDIRLFRIRDCGFNGCYRRIQGYLIPSFSRHPLNFCALLVVFLGSFSFTSLAHAFEDDGTWVSNNYYYVSGYYPSTASPTASGACTAYGNIWGSVGTHSGTRCNLANGGWQTLNGPFACSGSMPASAACGESPAPVNNCPEKFTKKRLFVPVNGHIENGMFFPDKDSNNSDARYRSNNNGCEFVHPGTYEETDADPNTKFSCNAQKQCFMYSDYVATGEPVPEGDTAPTTQSEDDESATLETDSSQSQLSDSETVVETPPETITDANGSQVTTSSKVETLIKNEGVKVTSEASNAVITESGGIKKTVTTSVTEIVYPDGKKDVITDRQVSYEQTDKTVYVVDKDGRKTVTNVPGSSASTSEKTTDNYDAGGNKTGSSTEKSDSGGEEKEGEEQEGENCEDKPEAIECKEYDGPADDGLYQPGEKTFDSVMGDFTSGLQGSGVMQAATGFFDVSVSGYCESWDVDAWIFSFSFDQHCSPIMSTIFDVISAVLLFIASIYAFRVAFL